MLAALPPTVQRLRSASARAYWIFGTPSGLLSSCADRRSRELGARLELVGKVEREVGRASGLMEGVETEIARKKEVSRKVRGAAGAAVIVCAVVAG
jgi:hypothetical protein